MCRLHAIRSPTVTADCVPVTSNCHEQFLALKVTEAYCTVEPEHDPQSECGPCPCASTAWWRIKDTMTTTPVDASQPKGDLTATMSAVQVIVKAGKLVMFSSY